MMLAVIDFLDYWLSENVKTYYQIRYGYGWRWYYLNWEQNKEFLF